MGRHPTALKTISLPKSVGRKSWRSTPSGCFGYGWSNRKPVPISGIKVGKQAVPRSLVLSFYAILRGSPIIVSNVPSHESRLVVPPCTSPSLRHSHRWQSEPLSFQYVTTDPISSFQYPGLVKRGYKSDANSLAPQSTRARKQPSGRSGNVSDNKGEKSALPPQRSALHPPKQAPSVWQIFFTDWLQRQKTQEGDGKKLNVAQEAKEAGHVYNELSEEARDALKDRAVAFKEQYEREFTAWKRTLTPADIERENAFRAAQRKSGKSRRKNINDPNAPKRPLTAYFLFLQAIRADARMVKDIFGDTTETTRQSVLAAAKWRSMNEEEKRPYLAQAEKAKLEYEVVRKAYDEQLRSSADLEYTMASVMLYPASPPEASTTPRRKSEDDGDTVSCK